MPKVSIIYFSVEGHTEQVANAVVEGASAVAGTEAKPFRVVGTDVQGLKEGGAHQHPPAGLQHAHDLVRRLTGGVVVFEGVHRHHQRPVVQAGVEG